MSVFFLLNIKADILKNVDNQTVAGTHWLPQYGQKKLRNAMRTNNCLVTHIIQYTILCSAEERNSYRFGTTLGWVNDDSIFIFGWTIPLTKYTCKAKTYTKYLSVCLCLYSTWWLHKDVPFSSSCFESWDFAVASSTWAEMRSWISFTIVSTVALLNSSMKSANSFWNTKKIKISPITLSCVSKIGLIICKSPYIV